MTYTDAARSALARIELNAAEVVRELETALSAAVAVRDAAGKAGRATWAADLDRIELEALRMAYGQTLARQHGAAVANAIITILAGEPAGCSDASVPAAHSE